MEWLPIRSEADLMRGQEANDDPALGGSYVPISGDRAIWTSGSHFTVERHRHNRDNMAKKLKTVFVCQECGYESPKWLGQCICGAWGSMVEEKVHDSVEDMRGRISVTSQCQKKQRKRKISILAILILLICARILYKKSIFSIRHYANTSNGWNLIEDRKSVV